MSIDIREAVHACARELADHKGGDTIVLDLTNMSTWTDYFVIATATSSTHLRALVRHADEALSPLGFGPVRRPQPADDEQWCLVDYGDFVVHIMTGDARQFYELEKLWFQAGMTKIEPSGGSSGPGSDTGQAGTFTVDAGTGREPLY